MRTKPEPTSGAVIDLCFYLTLSGGIIFMAFQGPVSKLSKGETRFVETTNDGSFGPIRLPTLAVCRAQNNEYTCGDGGNLTQCIQSGQVDPKNFSGLVFRDRKVLKDYFRGAFFMDPARLFLGDEIEARVGIDDFFMIPGNAANGNCFAVDFEKVPGVKEALHKLNATCALLLKFLENDAQGGQEQSYAVSLYENGDHFSAGYSLREDSMSGTRLMRRAMTHTFALDITLEERITNCEPAESKRPISRCLENYVSRVMGKDCFKNYSSGGNCSAEEKTTMVSLMSRLKVSRLTSLTRLTGCLSPCRRVVYRLHDLLSFPSASNPRSLVASSNDTVGRMDDDTAIFAVRIPNDEDVTIRVETSAYTFGDFVSEIGGLSGLFLGLSIWAVWNKLRTAVHFLPCGGRNK